ncbi:MAG: hypothetical protein HY707_13940 [Ignavibacteriae bacterium]|nr:hypothetical protein [Ignavibacteriota bacterium]
MNKMFDAVKFQRERRRSLAEKLTKMTPKEMVKFFKSFGPATSRRKRMRTTSA